MVKAIVKLAHRCNVCGKVLPTARQLGMHTASTHVQRKRAPRRTNRRMVGPVNQQMTGAPLMPMTTPQSALIRTALARGAGRPRTAGAAAAIGRSLTGIKLGNTQDGTEWARRVLHPADETMGGGIGIPDQASSESVVAEMRTDSIVTAPTGTGNWDLSIFITNSVDCPLVFKKKLTTQSWDETFWAQLNPGQTSIDTGRFQLGYSSVEPNPITPPTLLSIADQSRVCFRSVTAILDCNAISNQGIVTAAQWGNEPD
jgi:hypothetical protein